MAFGIQSSQHKQCAHIIRTVYFPAQTTPLCDIAPSDFLPYSIFIHAIVWLTISLTWRLYGWRASAVLFGIVRHSLWQDSFICGHFRRPRANDGKEIIRRIEGLMRECIMHAWCILRALASLNARHVHESVGPAFGLGICNAHRIWWHEKSESSELHTRERGRGPILYCIYSTPKALLELKISRSQLDKLRTLSWIMVLTIAKLYQW